MRNTLRTSTALIASLSLFMGHVPPRAFAQDLDLSQCAPGEDEDACRARLLEEGATEDEGEEAAAEEPDRDAAAAEAEADRAADDAAAEEAAREAAEAEADRAADD
ncbi:MAG: hypothetical protein ACOCY0_03065, partial [Roseicyclus sp.]